MYIYFYIRPQLSIYNRKNQPYIILISLIFTPIRQEIYLDNYYFTSNNLITIEQ